MKKQYGFEPYTQKNLREVLGRELKDRQEKNSNYSLRALARDFNISHPALSEFLNGKRKFSPNLSQSIISQLSLATTEKDKLIKSHTKNPQGFLNLNSEEIFLSKQWYVSALAELVKVADFKGETKWIANALGLNPELVEKATQSLKKLGWIEINKSGKWRIRDDNTSSLGNISAKEDILHSLSQFCDLQKKAIQNIKPEQSSITGITFAIDPDDLPKARELAYEFLHNMSELLERKSAHKKEVYRLNVALFPISDTTSKT